MNLTMKTLFSFLVLILGLSRINAQDASIQLGNTEIAQNQYFTISVQVKNDRLKQYSKFPEIDGLIKQGTSSSTSTNFVNGRMSSTQTITQNYLPTAQGSFQLSPFSMTINGKQFNAPGATINVGEPIQRQSRRRRDPFDDFFNRRNEPTEFVEVEADAFLALTTSKNEVYVGEGFTATLAFYVAGSNEAEMRFYDLSNQITEIVKMIKPSNCWEENFTIDQIVGEPITIKNKKYTRFKIYQTAYYPLNLGEVVFPSTSLKMIKYKEAKNPTFFGRNRQEDYETFYSKPKVVKVVDLPQHPLKDRVAVGEFELEEIISSKSLNTGQSFNYEFKIVGEGNISGIEGPNPENEKIFDFYSPNIKQSISRSGGRVRGIKSYDFYAIPNEPGNYNLSDFFQWIYFNTKTDNYDTLQSKISVMVDGESRKDLSIASNDLGDFYNEINSADNSIKSLKPESWIKYLINIFVVIILGFTAFLLFKKPIT